MPPQLDLSKDACRMSCGEKWCREQPSLFCEIVDYFPQKSCTIYKYLTELRVNNITCKQHFWARCLISEYIQKRNSPKTDVL